MTELKLQRTLAQYAGASPRAVSDGSPQQMFCFVEDAKKDIAALAAENDRLRTNLEHWRQEVGKEASQIDRLARELVDVVTILDAVKWEVGLDNNQLSSLHSAKSALDAINGGAK